MRTDSFSAAQGETFNFIDEEGTPWEGHCTELRPIAGGLIRIQGRIRKGPPEKIGEEIRAQYDPTDQSLSLL